MSDSKDKNDYVTKTGLKERGWTDSIIKKMGVVPDREAPNPHYRSAAPTKLYLISKIEKLENTPEFKELIEKSQKRKLGAQKAVETKKQNLLKQVEDLAIEVAYIPEPDLTDLAIFSYNEWQTNRPSVINGNNDFLMATRDSDAAFLHRIRQNFIRHNLTNYDELLRVIKGKVGVTDAYIALKGKVLFRIRAEWERKKGIYYLEESNAGE